MPSEPHYNDLRVRDEEMHLIWEVQRMEDDVGIVPEERTSRLRRDVELKVYVGDRALGRFTIDGNDAVIECAKVGAKLHKNLLSYDWNKEADAQVQDYLNGNEHQILIKDSVAASTVPAAIDKPHGVKTAVFELNEELLSKDSALEATIRKEYPWASIRTSAPRVSELEDLFQDIATFMSEHPPNGVFEVPSEHLPHLESWTAVPLRRKFDIAHARAIQACRLGETRNPSQRCASCQKNDYTCRVYRRTILEHVTQMKLINPGKACQNCRLLGIECDLPPYHLHSASNVAENSPGINGAAREASFDLFSETTVATPDSPFARHILASRVDKEDPRGLSNVRSALVPPNNINDVVQLGKQLGLDLQRADVVWLIYKEWRETKYIDAFVKGKYNLQNYYMHLVDLYIIAHKTRIEGLEYDILLQFQATNFQEAEQMPHIDESAIKPFKHLPVQSPLCRWIVILFSYLWHTQQDINYEAFHRRNQDLDHKALNKFLFGVSHVRDPLTKGGDAAVRKRWCEVHNHAPGSKEESRCHELRNPKVSNNRTRRQGDYSRSRSNKREQEYLSPDPNYKKMKSSTGYHHDPPSELDTPARGAPETIGTTSGETLVSNGVTINLESGHKQTQNNARVGIHCTGPAKSPEPSVESSSQSEDEEDSDSESE
ncbi:hypothetical protein N0V90_004678 [Kalmusia sp. IMI 367209]|nr:hypothetical protein N0V90_004678 [Kalmusia sp. IMI 367209]